MHVLMRFDDVYVLRYVGYRIPLKFNFKYIRCSSFILFHCLSMNIEHFTISIMWLFHHRSNIIVVDVLLMFHVFGTGFL